MIELISLLADYPQRANALCGMKIDDELIYDGRRWIIRGFARLSTGAAHVSLQNVASGEWRTIALAELEPSGRGDAKREQPLPGSE